MKVWIPSIQSGSGADVFVRSLAESLTHQGIDVHVQWFPLYYEFCPYLLRKVKPPKGTGIIFVNSWTAVAFTRHSIPVVNIMHHCVHDPDYLPYKSIGQSLYHRLLIHFLEHQGIKQSTVLVAGSRFTQDAAHRVFQCPPLRLIYYSVDTDKFRPAPVKKNNREFKLIYMGNRSGRKGFDLLPAIMASLGPRFKLYFTSGLRNSKPSAEIPYSECTGRLSDSELIALYQESDALIFPTRYEGFGYAAAEAMACGLPVVSTHCSSLPELIDEGKGGFLCPVNDVTAYVEKIRQLANSPSLTRQMGEYNRDKAVALFNPERMATEYLALFEEILDHVE